MLTTFAPFRLVSAGIGDQQCESVSILVAFMLLFSLSSIFSPTMGVGREGELQVVGYANCHSVRLSISSPNLSENGEIWSFFTIHSIWCDRASNLRMVSRVSISEINYLQTRSVNLRFVSHLHNFCFILVRCQSKAGEPLYIRIADTNTARFESISDRLMDFFRSLQQ